MDPIALILQALENSTAPDLGIEAMAAGDVQDESDDFAALLASKFADSVEAQAIIERYVAQPDLYEGVLVDMLRENNIDQDTDVLDAAKTLMETMNPRGAMHGDYTVDYDDEDLEHFV